MQKNELPELWTHQKAAIAAAGNRYALFFDPGCGKTRTAIEIYKKHLIPSLKADEILTPINSGIVYNAYCNAIIFAPLNVCRNWEQEIEKYLQIPFRVFISAGQTKPAKLKILKAFNESPLDKHNFLICNTESLRSKEYRALIIKSQATFIIADESHQFKSPTSLQTKGLFEVVKALKPTNLYLLTGTPAPQGEIDLWTTFALLGKTEYNFFFWRKKYFADKNERRRGYPNYWPDYRITQASRQYFQQLLAECSMTAKKDEVLDLPELLRTNIYAELTGPQRKHYDTMREFLFAIDSEGNELNASNLLSRTLRLQQILAGFLGDVPIQDNPRLKALDDAIIKTNGEQFIIWTIFKATYRQLSAILDKLEIPYGLLTGEQSAEERHETMGRFQAGELRALIAHPKAGGVGVNLTAASYSIHYTRNYSLVDDLQAEARNYRGGSEIHKRITRIDIITPETIDEEIVSALREKKSVQDFILGLRKQNKHREAA